MTGRSPFDADREESSYRTGWREGPDPLDPDPRIEADFDPTDWSGNCWSGCPYTCDH